MDDTSDFVMLVSAKYIFHLFSFKCTWKGISGTELFYPDGLINAYL